MERVGGRAIHPVNVRLGGFYRAPARAELTALAEPLNRALDTALETVRWVAGFEFPDHHVDADLLALTQPGTYAIERGTFATRSGLSFARPDSARVIEEQVPHSTALHARLAGRRPVPHRPAGPVRAQLTLAVPARPRSRPRRRARRDLRQPVPQRRGTGGGDGVRGRGGAAPDRRLRAAGPAVIARLRDLAPPGVRLVITDGEPARLVEAWTGCPAG